MLPLVLLLLPACSSFSPSSSFLAPSGSGTAFTVSHTSAKIPLTPFNHNKQAKPSLPASLSSSSALFGKLDDFTADITPGPADDVDVEDQKELESRESTNYPRSNIKNAAAGDFSGYVEFDTFDGGDGQTGTVGDKFSGLAKIGEDTQDSLVPKSNQQVYRAPSKSRERSAKVAWGTSTGYADKLRDKGMETSRAQQLENWANQNNVNAARKASREESSQFDTDQSDDADWKKLSSFKVDRNDDFDLNEAFGPVVPGTDFEDTITVKANMGGLNFATITLRNEFMGFADFRCAFPSGTSGEWTVEPTEGSLRSSEDTEFVVTYRPESPTGGEVLLVIDTEDMKKTYKFLGNP